MNSWRKFTRLSGWEQRLLAQALLLLPLAGLLIRLAGFERCRRLFARLPARILPPTMRSEHQLVDKAQAVARLVKIAATHGPYRGKCLQQSLTLWSCLRRNGIPAEIVFGARKWQQKLKAHAWVELNGQVINEHQAVKDHFAVLKPFRALSEDHLQ